MKMTSGRVCFAHEQITVARARRRLAKRRSRNGLAPRAFEKNVQSGLAQSADTGRPATASFGSTSHTSQ